MSNAVLERIHRVLGNLVRTYNITQAYVDEDDPCLGILDASAFLIFSTTNMMKVYSPDQLIFVCDIILSIKNTVDWELICQKKKTQINKDNILENRDRVDHDYKVGDNFMLTKHTAYKYETPYMGPFVITQCFTNGMVKLQCGATQIAYNIRCIEPYKFDAKVEDISSKNMSDDVNI